MITLPICRQQYSSFNDDKRGIFHTLINTSFASRSSCAFFVQGGLSPPEFCCAFLKVQKVPSWNERSAPLTKNKRPPDEEKAPPWKGGSTHKFPAAHQKRYMGHSVSRDDSVLKNMRLFWALWRQAEFIASHVMCTDSGLLTLSPARFYETSPPSGHDVIAYFLLD